MIIHLSSSLSRQHFQRFPHSYFTWLIIIFFRLKRYCSSSEDTLSSRQNSTSLLSFSLEQPWISQALLGLFISQFSFVISPNSLSRIALSFLCPNTIYCPLLFIFIFFTKLLASSISLGEFILFLHMTLALHWFSFFLVFLLPSLVHLAACFKANFPFLILSYIHSTSVIQYTPSKCHGIV